MKQENRKLHGSCDPVVNINWLQRIGIAGFIFFLAKGMVWIAAVTWAVY